MTPPEEIRRRLEGSPPRLLSREGWRHSGVLVPLLQHPGGYRLLLTRRSEGLRRHGGQVALPGGVREDGEDLAETALRESREEIGLDPRRVEVLGRLDDAVTPSGFILSPFVGLVRHPVELRPCPREVSEILQARVEDLLRPGACRLEQREHQGQWYPVVFFEAGGFTIWGATGRIVARLLEVAFGWHAPGEYNLP